MGSRTRDYANRDLRYTSIPESAGGSDPIDAYYLIPVEDDWRGSTTPPTSPGTGLTWIVPLGATGAWAGQDGAMATWTGVAWIFAQGAPGATAYIRARNQRAQVVDFNHTVGVLNVQIATSSANCVAWVPDHVLDQIEGPYLGVIQTVANGPGAGSWPPWYQAIVGGSAPYTWPNYSAPMLDSVAVAVVDQSTNSIQWVYRIPPEDTEYIQYAGEFAFDYALTKFIYYASGGIAWVPGTLNWHLLGNNIYLRDLADNLNPTGNAGKVVAVNPGGTGFQLQAGSGVNMLAQLTGDVQITEGALIAGDFLQWSWPAAMWVAHSFAMSDIPQTGATVGQVIGWNGSVYAPTTPAGGVVPTKLMQLTGDVAVSDNLASDKQFLQWNNSVAMWVGHNLALTDLPQTGATVGQFIGWTAGGWASVTPSGGSGGFAYAGAAWDYASNVQSWVAGGWNGSPRWSVPAGVAYMRVDINVQGTLATGGGYLTVTATRRNSLGTAYSGVTAVLTRIAQLSAVTSGSFSENLNGVMQAATGDYITITTVFSPGSLGSITSIPIQLTKVG